MPAELKCRATTKAGRKCRSPARLVDPESGFCPSHDPAKRQSIIEAARKGGEAAKRMHRKKGLENGELPPLDSPEQAERWLEIIGRAVATGRLGHHEGRTITGAVREWVKAYETGRLKDQIESGLHKIRAFEERQRREGRKALPGGERA